MYCWRVRSGTFPVRNAVVGPSACGPVSREATVVPADWRRGASGWRGHESSACGGPLAGRLRSGLFVIRMVAWQSATICVVRRVVAVAVGAEPPKSVSRWFGLLAAFDFYSCSMASVPTLDFIPFHSMIPFVHLSISLSSIHSTKVLPFHSIPFLHCSSSRIALLTPSSLGLELFCSSISGNKLGRSVVSRHSAARSGRSIAPGDVSPATWVFTWTDVRVQRVEHARPDRTLR